MDASWKNCLEEELLCPICLNVFDEPAQLPCKHNFCRACIAEAWARDSGAVRCPECNHDYGQKPALEKNFKLANIVKRFNALNSHKAPAALHCVLCRRGPPMPVRKVCLRCKEPCCQGHVRAHLQQPCAAPGHLLVDADELGAWTCPSHDEYRVFHCEDEQAALCAFCCVSHCAAQRHAVRDVDTQRVHMQAMLMRHQDSLEGRVQNIDEQLTKLESDKALMRNAVSELKKRVRAQYHRMHALLEAKQAETMQMLESTCTAYMRKSSQQHLQLNKRHQEAEKLLGSVQSFFQRAEKLNIVKNTKPYQLLLDRSNSLLTSAVPQIRVGQLNSQDLLSELSTREKNMRNILEEPLSKAPVLEIVQANGGSGPRSLLKRPHKASFLGGSDTENAASHEPPPSPYGAKKPFLLGQGHHAAPAYPAEGLSHSGHAPLGHSRPLDAGLSSASGAAFPSGHLLGGGGGSSSQAAYESRKVLMCTLNNCRCSRAPAGRARPPYPTSDSFPSVTSQEFPPHALLPASQPLQHYPVVGLLEASHGAGHHSFYGLYGQSSTKHFGTK